MQRSEMAAKIFSENLWLLRKWKSVILPEHALKENGDKLVIEFLSTYQLSEIAVVHVQEETISFKAPETINSAESSFSADNLPIVVHYFF